MGKTLETQIEELNDLLDKKYQAKFAKDDRLARQAINTIRNSKIKYFKVVKDGPVQTRVTYYKVLKFNKDYIEVSSLETVKVNNVIQYMSLRTSDRIGTFEVSRIQKELQHITKTAYTRYVNKHLNKECLS